MHLTRLPRARSSIDIPGYSSTIQRSVSLVQPFQSSAHRHKDVSKQAIAFCMLRIAVVAPSCAITEKVTVTNHVDMDVTSPLGFQEWQTLNAGSIHRRLFYTTLVRLVLSGLPVDLKKYGAQLRPLLQRHGGHGARAESVAP